MTVTQSKYIYDNQEVRVCYQGTKKPQSKEIEAIIDLCKKEKGSFDKSKLAFKSSKTIDNVDLDVLKRY